MNSPICWVDVPSGDSLEEVRDARRAPASRRRRSGRVPVAARPRGPMPIQEAVDCVLAACAMDGAIAHTFWSPFYMSPEQVCAARHVGARTDVWGLGVLLYELLTGRVPFEGDSAFAVFMGIAADTPPSPRVLRPEIPVVLEDVVLRCLQKDVRRRVRTIAELVAALQAFGSRRAAG